MKKILCLIGLAGMICAKSYTQHPYTIFGEIEGVKKGDVYLFIDPKGENDTLAHAEIIDGKFLITGESEETKLVYIGLEGTEKCDALPYLSSGRYFSLLYPFFLGEGNYTWMGNGKWESDNPEEQLRNQFNALDRRDSTAREQLLLAHPDSYLAACELYWRMNRWFEQPEFLKAKFDALGPKAQASNLGKKIAERLLKLVRSGVGDLAPNFTLSTPEGKALNLHDIKGKVKLIDFWASWCGPCRRENPNVVKVYAEYHPKGLEIIGVSLDNNKTNWLAAIEMDGLKWIHLSDLKGWQNEAVLMYGVESVPHTVLLDADNRIIAKNLRGDALHAKIAELLNN